MRELKFRAWDKKERKYLSPESQSFIIVPTRPSFGVTLPYENCSNPGNIDEDCFDWADADLLLGRYELEQYTGLKDRNGKEIYEGDIVDYNDDGGFIGVVKYDAPEFYIESGNVNIWAILKGAPHQMVIGNIHENPEFLSGKEEEDD